MVILRALLFCSLPVFFFSCQKESGGPDHVPLKPSELYLLDRFGPGTETFIKNKQNLVTRIKTSMQSRTPGFEGLWTLQGPANIGARVSALALHPKNENIMYAGFSNGGIFKTTDGGSSWKPIFDGEANLAIGAVALDPKDPDIIYVGTGDPDIPGNVFTGNGLYKSVNGGQSWQHIGLAETRIINEILVDPEDPSIVYAAAMGNPFTRNDSRGLYKSEDAGRSWNRVLFIDPSTGITDIAIKPGDSKTIYAAAWHRVRNDSVSTVQGTGSGVYRSTDRGSSWQKIHQGIDNLIFGRIALGVSADDPDRVYARIVRSDTGFCQGGHQFSQLYRSDDSGSSWKKVNITFDDSQIPCSALGGFGWYFGRMGVNPKNADDLLIMGVDMYRSKDGGQNWYLATPPWWTYEVHADKHEIEWLENGDFILGTDGGLYRYHDSEDRWSDIENIPTTQFYRVAYNPHRPDWYYGGAQDNGTSGGNATDLNNWERIYGGDGFLPAFHPTNPDIFWTLTQNGGLAQTQDRGASFDRFTNGLTGTKNWDMPYMISPHDPDIMYAGAQRMFINRNAIEDDWQAISPNLATGGPYRTAATATLTCLDESPLQPGILITGSNSGNVWISRDSGANWTRVNGSLPPSLITSVKCSREDSNTFYVSSTSYRNDQLRSLIFRTRDNGQTWEDITGGALTEIPVFDLQFLKKSSDKDLAAATLTGVYACVDGKFEWKRVGTNMPIIPVNDLEVNPVEGTLIAGSYARSILSFPLEKIRLEPSSTGTASIPIKASVWPNPARDQIEIHAQLSGWVQIRIMGMEGKEYGQSQLYFQNEACQQMDVRSLPEGQYQIILEQNSDLRKVPFQKIR